MSFLGKTPPYEFFLKKTPPYEFFRKNSFKSPYDTHAFSVQVSHAHAPIE